MSYRCRWLVWPALGLFGLLSACTGKEPATSVPPAEADADTDADSDTDADTDADPDADTDADTDADADTDPDPAPYVRFIALGDIGTGSDLQASVADAAAAICGVEGCDFALLLGDNFYQCGVTSIEDEQFQTTFEAMYDDPNLAMPFNAILGNHAYYAVREDGEDGGGSEGGSSEGGGTGPDDTGEPGPMGPICGPDGGFEHSQGQAQVDYTTAYYPEQTWFHMPGVHWMQDPIDPSGHVALVGLDTERLTRGFDDEGEPGTSAQWTTLATQIHDSTTGLKIVAAHHPYRSNGKHGNAGTFDFTPEGEEGICDETARTPDSPQAQRSGICYAEYVEEHVCGEAALMLSGHDHNLQLYASVEGCDDTMFVVSGSAGKSSSMSEDGKNDPDFASDAPGFAWVELCGPKSRVEQIRFYDDQQVELHAWVHPDHESTPCVDDEESP